MKIFDFAKKLLEKIPLLSRSQRMTSSRAFSFTQRNNDFYYNGWVYAAVRAISDEVANIKLALFQKDKNGEVERIPDHPALDLLHNVNGYFTQYDLFERLQSNLEMIGNEYWFLELDEKKQPIGIFPLDPSLVSPIGGKFEYVVGYEYRIDGDRQVLPPECIIQFKNYNPLSDIVGYPTLEAARSAADTDIFTREYNKRYFQNSARPDVILEYPATLSEADQTRLLEEWKQNHQGAQRQFKTAIASGGLQIKAFQMSQKDMEFLEQRRFSKEEILGIFRVPPTILGTVEDATFASAKAANFAFAQGTITPKMRKIVNALNEFLLPSYGDSSLFFDFISPVPEDRELLIQEYASGIANGWMTVNEVRRREDLPDVQGGDTARLPFNLQPLGEVVTQPKSVRESPIQKMSKKIIGSMTKAIPEPEKKDVIDIDVEAPQMTEEEKAFERMGEFRVKQRDERGLEFENLFEEGLLRLWSGQMQRAINNLTSILVQKSRKQNFPPVLDVEKEVSATLDIFTPILSELTEKESMAAAAFLGQEDMGGSSLNAKLIEFILENSKKFAIELTEQTQKTLRGTLAAGLEKGEGLDELKDRITDSTSFNRFRAEKIARTETIRAQSKAEISVWEDSGVVSGKIWYTALDERVCPFCEPLHGKIISLKNDFFKEGDTQTGNDGSKQALNYENVSGPPLHPQCRCTLIPVVNNKNFVQSNAKKSTSLDDETVFRTYLKHSNG